MMGSASTLRIHARSCLTALMIATTALAACDGGPPRSADPSSSDSPSNRVAARSYSVGVAVSGVSGSGLVLQINSGSDLNIGSNGNFVFLTGGASGANYAVTVLSQPSSPTQTCTVANRSGTIRDADVMLAVTSLTAANAGVPESDAAVAPTVISQSARTPTEPVPVENLHKIGNGLALPLGESLASFKGKYGSNICSDWEYIGPAI